MTQALKYLSAQHRKALSVKLSHGVVCGIGNREVIRNNDVTYPFRQESNFLYLTGIEAQGYAFILIPKENKYLLFIPKIDAKHVVWLGEVPSPLESKKIFGADQVFYMNEFEGQLKKYSQKLKTVYSLNKKSSKLMQVLTELRIVKSPEELRLMQTAATISSKAHVQAMQVCQSGLWEYQIQSRLEQSFLNAGAKHVAYGSIVAGGKNSAVLHYFQNKDKLQKKDLLLIDAGAEVHGYASDITRTFPVSGKFSSGQKDIYQATLNAQEAAIKMAKAGTTFAMLHEIAAKKILEGLKDMGLLKGSISAMLQKGVDRLFFPHGVGHFLGLDVHDVGRYSVGLKEKSGILRANRKLEKNHVITVEPGIYFIPVLLKDPKNRKKFIEFVQWPKVDRFLNFGGVRIEDDVVITQKGPSVLTAKCPKRIEDLEKIIGTL